MMKTNLSQFHPQILKVQSILTRLQSPRDLSKILKRMINGVHYTFKVHAPMEFLGGDVATHIPEDVVITLSMEMIDGEDAAMARIVNSFIPNYVLTASN